MKTLAEEFFAYWKAECDARTAALLATWNNPAAYNGIIFAGPNSVVEAIAGQVGLQTYCEYYCIDVVFFAERDLVPTRPVGQTWLRRIRIAFEHEHRFGANLFEEVSHLLIIDCDLRVLVSYPNSKEQKEREKTVLHSLISGSDRADTVSAANAFLLISGSQDRSAGTIAWEGEVYRTYSWVPV